MIVHMIMLSFFHKLSRGFIEFFYHQNKKGAASALIAKSLKAAPMGH